MGMTIKEAIEILTAMYNYYSNTDDYTSYLPFDKEDKEALEMAINSLKQYEKGFMDGQKSVLEEIKNIMAENEYPEYLECDLYEYMKKQGVLEAGKTD